MKSTTVYDNINDHIDQTNKYIYIYMNDDNSLYCRY